MDKLKPCPFCGREAREFKAMSKLYGYGVRCINENCEATIRRCMSNLSAVKTWNTRKGEDNEQI